MARALPPTIIGLQSPQDEGIHRNTRVRSATQFLSCFVSRNVEEACNALENIKSTTQPSSSLLFKREAKFLHCKKHEAGGHLCHYWSFDVDDPRKKPRRSNIRETSPPYSGVLYAMFLEHIEIFRMNRQTSSLLISQVYEKIRLRHDGCWKHGSSPPCHLDSGLSFSVFPQRPRISHRCSCLGECSSICWSRQ